MDSNTLILLLCIIAGFIAGALIGILIGNRGGKRQEEENPQAGEPEKEEIQRAEKRLKDIEEPVQEPPAVLTGRTREGFIPVVCVWRGRETGKFAAEIKGKLFLEPAALGAEGKEKMEELGREWLTWLGVESETSSKETTANFEERLSAASLKPAASTSPVPAAESAKLASVEPVIDFAKSEIKAKSMIEQIDEILQEMLVRSHLSNRGIRIMEDALHGVNVWIGLKRYTSIDEVEDQEALTLIRAAVAEWEKRSGGPRGV